MNSAILDAPTALTRVTLNDFMTGFLAALAVRHVKVVLIRDSSFYRAIVNVFEQLESTEHEHNLKLLFWLTQDPIHGDAPEIREGITRAVQRDLISLDNPTYQQMRLKITPDDADLYFRKLPGGKDLYLSLADHFMHEYRSFS